MIASLFDLLVGAGKERRRYGQAKTTMPVSTRRVTSAYELKKQVNGGDALPLYHTREIWWAHLGVKSASLIRRLINKVGTLERVLFDAIDSPFEVRPWKVMLLRRILVTDGSVENCTMRTTVAAMIVAVMAAACDDPRADCAKVQRDPDRAIRACTAIISAGRDTKHNVALALYNRGIAHNNKGNYDIAISDFTQSLSLNRSYTKAYYNRALAHYSKGDNEAAITDYTEALRLNPKDRLAHSRRGAANLNKGDYPAAVADTTEAIRIDPRDDFAYGTRAAAHYLMSNYDQAVADFTEAIRITPRDAKRYVARGWAYYKLLKTASALSDADHAIALSPTNPTSHELRAYIHERLGRRDDAIADLRAALRVDPRRQESRKALQRLGAQP